MFVANQLMSEKAHNINNLTQIILIILTQKYIFGHSLFNVTISEGCMPITKNDTYAMRRNKKSTNKLQTVVGLQIFNTEVTLW